MKTEIKPNNFILNKVAVVNKSLKSSRYELNVSLNGSHMSVKFINTDTKETIREIPPEETKGYIANMLDLAGILIDKKG